MVEQRFSRESEINCSKTTGEPLPIFTEERVREGLGALIRAFIYARSAGASSWDFALGVEELGGGGLSVSELRWMVAKGYVEHGSERSELGDLHRTFDRGQGFRFWASSCLVLTAPGADFVSQLLAGRVGDRGAQGVKPSWDSSRRELWFGDKLVKRYRVPARNQQWILDVFEEEGWPNHIDDPLPPTPDIDSRTRLHDAIHRLNGKQVTPLVRFHGNGSGDGVLWDIAASRVTPDRPPIATTGLGRP